MNGVGNKRQTGFTIVELLIVVVVIAILATITVVAFTGIQQQARNTTLLAAIDSYEKAIRMYYTENGSYPSTDAGSQSFVYVCLGTDYPERDGFGANNCFADLLSPSPQAGGVVNATVNQALAKYLSPLPETSSMVFNFNGGPYTRGVLYLGGRINGIDEAAIVYYINGDQKCGRGEKQTGPSGGSIITFCQVKIEN